VRRGAHDRPIAILTRPASGVNGRRYNGDRTRTLPGQYGWGRYENDLVVVSGAGRVRLGPSVRDELRRLRVYARHLRTSQAVANFHAGP